MKNNFTDVIQVEIDDHGDPFYLTKCNRAYTYTGAGLDKVQTLTVTDENQVVRVKSYTYNGNGMVATESPWVRH